MWDSYNDHLGNPSSDHYKGTSPASTEEAKALIKLTEQYPFKRTVSYHTQGEVIYWYFAQTGDLLNESKAFAESASAVTGYPLDADYTKLGDPEEKHSQPDNRSRQRYKSSGNESASCDL